MILHLNHQVNKRPHPLMTLAWIKFYILCTLLIHDLDAKQTSTSSDDVCWLSAPIIKTQVEWKTRMRVSGQYLLTDI